MAIKTIGLKRFEGGVSTTGEKISKANSSRFIKNLDIYEDPSYLTLSRKPTKVSGSTVTDLIYWGTDGIPYDTNKYFYDASGAIYRETSGDVWSKLRTIAGGVSRGEGMLVFDDYLYYASDEDLGRYGRLTGTPAFDDNLTSWWDAAIADIRTTGGGTGQTYATTTAINEGATHRQTFTATHDPLKEITIDINDTGDDPNWTVTVHDTENNTIGSKQTLFASVATGDNVFTFATALRLTIGNEYHFHVTTSTTTGAPKVTSDTASDLEGAEFIVEYGVLIQAEFHPIVSVEDKIIIGNEQYLAVFDGATYNPTKILLDVGFRVRAIDRLDEFIVISCYKGDNVSETNESRLFYWDTISTSWNFYTDATSVGTPNAIINTGNKLRGVYGNRGALYEGDRPFNEKFNEVPKLAKGKRVNVFPGAIAAKDNITLIGISGDTDDATGLEQGIYAYGSENNQLGDGASLLYTISTGTTQGLTLKIGFVKIFGDEIYFSWRDDSTYGVDKITPDAVAAISGVYESLIFDDESVNKHKLALKVQAECKALASGETLATKYQLDRSGSFTAGTAAVSAETNAEVGIYTRFREAEFGFTLTSSGGTFPKVTELSFEYNNLDEEKVR